MRNNRQTQKLSPNQNISELSWKSFRSTVSRFGVHYSNLLVHSVHFFLAFKTSKELTTIHKWMRIQIFYLSISFMQGYLFCSMFFFTWFWNNTCTYRWYKILDAWHSKYSMWYTWQKRQTAKQVIYPIMIIIMSEPLELLMSSSTSDVTHTSPCTLNGFHLLYVA